MYKTNRQKVYGALDEWVLKIKERDGGIPKIDLGSKKVLVTQIKVKHGVSSKLAEECVNDYILLGKIGSASG